MKILDLDMDYFMNRIASDISEFTVERLPEEDYGDCVWEKDSIIAFLENNLGLSKNKKIKGRIVCELPRIVRTVQKQPLW